MRLAPLLLLFIVPAVAAVMQGCGENRYVYQTRYIPRASELSFDEDYEQLVWQPPAIGEQRPSRPGRSPRPAYAPEINFDVDFKSSQANKRSDRELLRAADGKTYQINSN